MFIKSNSVSFTRNAMTHAMVNAALNTILNNKLEKTIADCFVKQKAKLSHDWTAVIHTRKNQLIVKALLA